MNVAAGDRDLSQPAIVMVHLDQIPKAIARLLLGITGFFSIHSNSDRSKGFIGQLVFG